VIDEGALLRALADKRIAGATLDVFETEPLPPDQPLWAMPNIVITPHISVWGSGLAITHLPRMSQCKT